MLSVATLLYDALPWNDDAVHCNTPSEEYFIIQGESATTPTANKLSLSSTQKTKRVAPSAAAV